MSDMVKAYLRWILSADDAPSVALADIGVELSSLAGVSAFALALERNFGEEVSEEQVRTFVARVRGRWIKPDGLNPVLAEQVILAAYTDDALIKDIPKADVFRTENLITYAILNEQGITGAAFEDFLDEVVAMVSEARTDRST